MSDKKSHRDRPPNQSVREDHRNQHRTSRAAWMCRIPSGVSPLGRRTYYVLRGRADRAVERDVYGLRFTVYGQNRHYQADSNSVRRTRQSESAPHPRVFYVLRTTCFVLRTSTVSPGQQFPDRSHVVVGPVEADRDLVSPCFDILVCLLEHPRVDSDGAFDL